MVPVPDRSGDRADQLEGRAGAAAGGREPEGVGRQPHGGRGARPRRADVGARDRPPTGAGNGRLHRCRLAGVWQPTHPPTGTATGTVNKYVKTGSFSFRFWIVFQGWNLDDCSINRRFASTE